MRGRSQRRSGAGGAQPRLDAALLTERPTAPAEAMMAARRQGVLTRALRGVALQISPPFVVTEDQLATMVEGLAVGVRETARQSLR